MQLGLYSFAENTVDGGVVQSPAERIADVLEEIALADQLGLDFYGLGEHHRPDFTASAPVTILAAAAAQTKSIRLSTAVTVLSSDDPIRVWEQFSTLDLLSHGRAEIMAGRGSFIESFPLFGYDLNDYDALFEEKLEMLLAIRKGAGSTGPVRRIPSQFLASRSTPSRSRTRSRSGSR
jgi:alkanesulfonate monooxygenase SsuD/methylene tetrahydromethanopterin reductase-like flavin-dependent oxidoreductase (luciferase family)